MSKNKEVSHNKDSPRPNDGNQPGGTLSVSPGRLTNPTKETSPVVNQVSDKSLPVKAETESIEVPPTGKGVNEVNALTETFIPTNVRGTSSETSPVLESKTEAEFIRGDTTGDKYRTVAEVQETKKDKSANETEHASPSSTTET